MNTPILTYLKAGYPGLILITPEEARAEAEVAEACEVLQRQLHAWSATEGLCHLGSGVVQICTDPIEALHHVETLFAAEEPRHVVMLKDLQLYLDQGDPLLVRRLRDLLRQAKSNGHALVLAGCRSKHVPELQHEFMEVELPLPDAHRLGQVLDGILLSAGLPSPEADRRDALLHSALGLTTIEAENAFALSLIECGELDPLRIGREKAALLRQTGLLELIDHQPGFADIGGLEGLKQWLQRRTAAFSPAARDYGLPVPKGLLIAGIPGTGKSLTAKATASALRLPLLRLDIGRVFGGIVGQSEANLRAIIRTAEAIAPCVLWIDEIEKGFSSGAGGSDGGTSARVLGGFLSWMQEKTKPVFVVATANGVSKLPPEFLRRGRFDEMFFVDLPTTPERVAIWQIVIVRSRRQAGEFDVTALAEATDGFTGAEIEAVWNEALHEAFAGTREPTAADIQAAIEATTPVSRLMEERIGALRSWSKGRAREAGLPVSTQSRRPKPARRISGLN